MSRVLGALPHLGQVGRETRSQARGENDIPRVLRQNTQRWSVSFAEDQCARVVPTVERADAARQGRGLRSRQGASETESQGTHFGHPLQARMGGHISVSHVCFSENEETAKFGRFPSS